MPSNPANLDRDRAPQTEQPCSARWRRKEELEQQRAFEAERRGDLCGEGTGTYWRSRKPSLDELDGSREAELADEPPPGWGRS